MNLVCECTAYEMLETSKHLLECNIYFSVYKKSGLIIPQIFVTEICPVQAVPIRRHAHIKALYFMSLMNLIAR